MTNENLKNEIQDGIVKPECIFECECLENKRYRLIFDGGDSGNYIVEYCQKCYDQDDKQYVISTEELF